MAKKFQSLIDRVIKLQTSGVQAPDKRRKRPGKREEPYPFARQARSPTATSTTIFSRQGSIIRDRLSRPTRWPDMALKEMSPSTPVR